MNGKVNIWHSLVSGLFILVMFLSVLILANIAPFGDKTFLMYDLKRQYVDYYAYYRTLLTGKNNIFYSFSTTLGSGIIGFFAYYMTSPFIMLLSLFSRDRIYLGITLIIGLKLILASFIMDFTLQKAFGTSKSASVFERNSASIYIGAVSWAFSGFLFAHSMNLMWIDVVMLLPIYIYFLEKLLVKNEKAPFIIVLSLMALLNYYITYQVVLFTALWTVVRIVVLGLKKPIALIWRVIYSSAISGAISAFLMIPTFLELMDSPKDVALLGMKLKNNNLSFVDLISKLPTLSYDEIEPRFGYPQLFCGVLLVTLILVYFLSKEIALKERIGMLFLVLFMMLSMGIDLLNIIWHAGMEPSGHPYRQAFFFVFLVILCSVRVLLMFEKKEGLVIPAVVLVVMLMGLFFIRRGGYDHISNKTIIVNLALILCYMAGIFISFNAKRNKERALSVIFSVFLLINILDLTANAYNTYGFQALKCESALEYSETISDNYKEFSYVKGNDRYFYRMENLVPRQQNDALQYDFNGITHYSSAGLVYARYFLQRLGYNDDNLYTGYGHDNTETADSLLGVKYLIGDGEVPVHWNYPLFHKGTRNSYLNPYALKLAVGTKDFDLEGISDPGDVRPDPAMTHVSALDPFSLQEDMYSRITGKEQHIFVDAEVSGGDVLETDGKFKKIFEVTAAMDGEMYMYLGGLIGAGEGLSVYRGEDFLTSYGNLSCTKVLNLGYLSKGESLEITVQAENEDDDFGEALFVTEDVSALEKAYEDADDRNCMVTRMSSSSLKIETKDYDGVFMTVPYQDGWNIKVDGKKTDAVSVYDCFTYVPIDSEKETHTVEMSFIPKGIVLGCIITILGISCLAIVVIMDKRRRV
ncbi:MAG: YfhO family protein [Butyrivibrio sp.]|uniref:YfhO family protein n=1 Tax=Butyrivibrio sp. TaxID=28121 RepID=UPI001B5645F0|nr:YfhO family protein [Butyrivibrio sp.]MBP3784386.1 YfhO family protein [Butyrivibrio sp.]